MNADINLDNIKKLTDNITPVESAMSVKPLDSKILMKTSNEVEEPVAEPEISVQLIWSIWGESEDNTQTGEGLDTDIDSDESPITADIEEMLDCILAALGVDVDKLNECLKSAFNVTQSAIDDNNKESARCVRPRSL